MTRAEILKKNLEMVEAGITRIKKYLPKLTKQNRDLPFSAVSYSMDALRVIRNIEIDVTGKSQEDVNDLYRRRKG